jgi:hypothetical protein
MMAPRLEPAEAARLCAEAARSHNHALTLGSDPYSWPFCNEQVAALLQSVDGESAAQAARVFVLRMVADPNRSCTVNDNMVYPVGDEPIGRAGPSFGLGFDAIVLERFLTNRTRPQTQRRTEAIASAIGISAPGVVRSLPLLPAACEPFPCRLSTQDLVELLKMPTCVGKVRRVILDQLGNRYGRRFETHWDFVRYAQEQGLNLDFTTPPQRPERKLPPLFAE